MNPDARRDERLATVLATLAVAARVTIDEPTVRLYREYLATVPIDELERAAVRVIEEDPHESCRYGRLPTIAEWRELAGAVDALTATEIYDRLVAILRRSPLRLPPGLHPFDEFVIRALGGSQALLTMDGQRMRYLCEQRAAEWTEVARVRGLMLPSRQRGEGAPPALPPPAAPLALPPPSVAPAATVPKPADKAASVSSVRSIRAAAEAVIAAGELASEEQIAARRAVLREQARQLGVSPKENPDGALR